MTGQFDRVFNILHGNNGGGEDGVLQGLLEALGVPYTGSGVLGSALEHGQDPHQAGVAVARPADAALRRAWRSGDDVHAAAREIGLPVIVKPACEGSSVGVSRVFTDADLDDAVALAAKYPGELLVEQMIVGDELTVGILGEIALPSIRIVPKGQWYDYHAKYVAEDTQYLCPGLEGADEDEIRRIALAAFVAAGCAGWGRVDVMRDRSSGQFYLLEVNTAPGMTSHSLVPKAARQMGVGFDELCWRILEMTVAGGHARSLVNAMLRIVRLDARADAGRAAGGRGGQRLDRRRALAAAHLARAGRAASRRRAETARDVLPYAAQGFFAVRLDDAQVAVAKLPWVQHAEVRKRWPDVVEVRIVEHRPFARWGKDRLLSEQGQLFPVAGAMRAEGLAATRWSRQPRVRSGGALQRIARVVRARRHRRARLDAGSPRQLVAAAVRRHRVLVGNSEARLRLTRFARLLPQLLSQKQLPLARADLRYTNGFALSWTAAPPRPAAPQSQGNT